MCAILVVIVPYTLVAFKARNATALRKVHEISSHIAAENNKLAAKYTAEVRSADMPKKARAGSPDPIGGGADVSGRWILYAVVVVVALAVAWVVYQQFNVTTVTIPSPAAPPPVPVGLKTSTLPTIAPIQPTH
jgi:hypothetical protein